MWSDIPTSAYVVALAGCSASFILGVMTKFLSDWMTDARRKAEKEKGVRDAFRECEQAMPEVFAAIRTGLGKDKYCRRLTLADECLLGFNGAGVQQANVIHRAKMLASKGFAIKSNEQSANLAVYELTDEFVAMLTNSERRH